MVHADPHEDRSRSAPASKESSSDSRMAYLDNLRAIAMLLGVYLHAALAYAEPANSVWLATDGRSSVLIDFSIWWIHLFRMSLFFAIAGYLGKMVYDRKGMKRFLVGRLVRIVLPFAVFYPLLLGAMTAVFVFALTYLESPQGLMGMIAEAYEKGATEGSLATEEAQKPGTMHLWFLYYLIYFTGLGIVGSMVAEKWKGMDVGQEKKERPNLVKLKAWMGQPWLAMVLPLLWIPAMMTAGMPLPAPESWVPTWWPFVFYGSFYFGGWLLFGNESFLDPYRRWFPALCGTGLLLLIPYYLFMPNLDLTELEQLQRVRWDWQSASLAGLTAYLSWMWTLLAWLLGERFLNVPSRGLRLIADASYWLYLIHLPIVVFLQTLLIPAEWPLVVKLLLVLVGTLVPGLASYLVFVRYSPIGWMLHGKRSFP